MAGRSPIFKLSLRTLKLSLRILELSLNTLKLSLNTVSLERESEGEPEPVHGK